MYLCRLVAVLSAMYGVTDRLVAAVKYAEKGDMGPVGQNSDEIKRYHEHTIDLMLGDTPWANNACKEYLHNTMKVSQMVFCSNWNVVRTSLHFQRGETRGSTVSVKSNKGHQKGT